MTNLSVQEAADYLRLRPQTLNNWRVMGKGPRFQKFGRRVVYSMDDLTSWANARRATNSQAAESIVKENTCDE